MSRNEKSLEKMYGPEDLSQAPIFQGGYINFGYWDSVPTKITPAQRIAASEALYRRVFSLLSLKGEEEVLEVGCGRGLGCQLLKAQHQGKIVGVDLTPEQIQRAREAVNNIAFEQGAAESLPFPAESFQALYSVEAAQHFVSFPQFAREAFRVLAPGGKLAVTTFFAEEESALPHLQELIPTIRNQIDRVIPLEVAVNAFQLAGFDCVQVERIGEFVWEGFDQWMAQTVPGETWGRHWLKAYRNQWLDYVMISAEKS